MMERQPATPAQVWAIIQGLSAPERTRRRLLRLSCTSCGATILDLWPWINGRTLVHAHPLRPFGSKRDNDLMKRMGLRTNDYQWTLGTCEFLDVLLHTWQSDDPQFADAACKCTAAGVDPEWLATAIATGRRGTLRCAPSRNELNVSGWTFEGLRI